MTIKSSGIDSSHNHSEGQKRSDDAVEVENSSEVGQSVEKDELTIDELANLSQVSIDTIRFYQQKGLLPPPLRVGRRGLYCRSHLERLQRISQLRAVGFSLKDISERLNQALFDGPSQTPPIALGFEEFSNKIGIPVPLVKAMIQEGILHPLTVGEKEIFNSDDIRMAEAALELLGYGLPFSDLLSIAKGHALRMQSTIDDAIELFEHHLRVPEDASKNEIEQEFKTFSTIQKTLGELIALHFSRLLTIRAQNKFYQTASPLEAEIVTKLYEDKFLKGDKDR